MSLWGVGPAMNVRAYGLFMSFLTLALSEAAESLGAGFWFLVLEYTYIYYNMYYTAIHIFIYIYIDIYYMYILYISLYVYHISICSSLFLHVRCRLISSSLGTNKRLPFYGL